MCVCDCVIIMLPVTFLSSHCLIGTVKDFIVLATLVIAIVIIAIVISSIAVAAIYYKIYKIVNWDHHMIIPFLGNRKHQRSHRNGHHPAAINGSSSWEQPDSSAPTGGRCSSVDGFSDALASLRSNGF